MSQEKIVFTRKNWLRNAMRSETVRTWLIVEAIMTRIINGEHCKSDKHFLDLVIKPEFVKEFKKAVK